MSTSENDSSPVVDFGKFIAVAYLGMFVEISGQFVSAMIHGFRDDRIHPIWYEWPMVIGVVIAAIAVMALCLWRQDAIVENEKRRKARIILIAAFVTSMVISAVAFPPYK